MLCIIAAENMGRMSAVSKMGVGNVQGGDFPSAELIGGGPLGAVKERFHM